MDSQIRADGLYFLKRNSLFGPLGDDVLAEVVSALKVVQMEKGDVALRADAPGDSLFLIRNGRVRIAANAEAGKEKAIAYLGRGDAVGPGVTTGIAVGAGDRPGIRHPRAVYSFSRRNKPARRR